MNPEAWKTREAEIKQKVAQFRALLVHMFRWEPNKTITGIVLVPVPWRKRPGHLEIYVRWLIILRTNSFINRKFISVVNGASKRPIIPTTTTFDTQPVAADSQQSQFSCKFRLLSVICILRNCSIKLPACHIPFRQTLLTVHSPHQS
jgi:hypothetical protein